MRRVFLDANVLLSGAFDTRGFAAKLPVAGSQVAFVTTERVLDECAAVLRTHSADPRIAAAGAQMLHRWVTDRLRAVVVARGDLLGASGLADQSDVHVVAGATAAEADLICTYNLSDFRSSPVRAITPLGLIDSLEDRGGVMTGIQAPLLGPEGTLLVTAKFHHVSSLGRILRLGDGTTIEADSEGFVRATGPQADRVRPLAPIRDDRFVSIVLRYRASGDFEVLMFLSSREPRELVTRDDLERVDLSLGRLSIAQPVTPLLVFEQNHRFFAAVINISGAPVFVKDARIPDVLSNTSLETVHGSLGAADIARRLEIVDLPGGGTYVGLRA